MSADTSILFAIGSAFWLGVLVLAGGILLTVARQSATRAFGHLQKCNRWLMPATGLLLVAVGIYLIIRSLGGGDEPARAPIPAETTAARPWRDAVPAAPVVDTGNTDDAPAPDATPAPAATSMWSDPAERADYFADLRKERERELAAHFEPWLTELPVSNEGRARILAKLVEEEMWMLEHLAPLPDGRDPVHPTTEEVLAKRQEMLTFLQDNFGPAVVELYRRRFLGPDSFQKQ